MKIIDFGLAGFDPRGRLIGTPSYMAPEIAAREHADGRADLYALGVLLYAALTRSNPFRARTTPETLDRQRSLTPSPPSAVDSTIPPWIDEIVMKLLEKNPGDRYATAAAVVRDINRLGGKRYPLETAETLLSYLPEEGRFVGRAEALARFEQASAVAPGEARGLIVRGALGTGKSRLLREVKYRLQLGGARVLLADATDAEALRCWREELGAHLGEGSGLKAFLLDDAEVLLADEGARGRFVAQLARMRRPATGAGAIVALAVDAALSDEALAAVEALLPERVELAPFSREEFEAYLVSLTGLAEPPAALTEELVRRSEGNPLFVTELLKALIARGGLFDEHGRWKPSLFEDVGVDFEKAGVPETMGGLLLARVADRNESERALCEALAVFGLPGRVEELAAWAGIADAHRSAAALIAAGIVVRREGHALAFENALLGRAIREALSTERRAALHDRIAATLIEREARSDRVLHHLSFGNDRDAARVAAAELGERMLAAARPNEAIDALARALELADDEEERVALTLHLGEAHLIGHDYDEARRLFVEAEEAIGAAGAAPERAPRASEALVRLGGTFIKLRDFDRARAAFAKAKRLLSGAVEDPARLLVIDNFLAGILRREGRPDEARRIFERTREEAMLLSADEQRRVTNNDLGPVLLAAGDHDAAARILEEDLARAEELGDDLLVARAAYHRGQLFVAQRAFDAAIESYERSAEVCRRTGNTELLLRVYNGLGNAHQLAGDAERSLACYERGHDLHERVGDLRGGAAIAINMGIIESQRGRREAALDRLIPAVEFLRGLPEKEAGDWAALSRGLLELGDLLHQLGDDSRAHETLDESHSIAARVPQAAPYLFWILATQAEIAKGKEHLAEFADLVKRMRTLAEGEEARGIVRGFEEEVKRLRRERAQALPREQWPPSESSSADAPAWRRILEINKLLVGEADVEHVLKNVLHYALEFTGAEGGAILLADEAGELTVAVGRDLMEDAEAIAFSRSVAGEALRAGRPIVTDDAGADARFATEASVSAGKLRSILALPIHARARAIGVLYLHNRFQAAAFANVDRVIIEAFADQAGLAIETARLLDRARRREEELSVELEEASAQVERYEAMLSRSGEPAFDAVGMVGRSAAMRRVIETLTKVADTDLSIVICGESGSGKELVARALHANHARRAAGRFVAINCGAIPPTLIESELFGYKKGAFTGADRDKAGLIEEASGGTLFLDEIGELAPALQVKLLRVLQEHACTRVGETQPRPVDIRVIAASNRDIDAMRAEGSFRDDLYFRLDQMRVDLSPLRERIEDLPLLVEHFLARYAPDRELRIHPRLMKRMMAYGWPGNIRELENAVQVFCALAVGETIDEAAIPEGHPLAEKRHERRPVAAPVTAAGKGIAIDAENAYDPARSWKEYERLIVAKCYAANEYHARRAAAELGIAPSTMYQRISKWGLDDRSAPVYAEPFSYARGTALADYRPRIFRAALEAMEGKAARAIANLGVSQGLFYKVIKEATA